MNQWISTNRNEYLYIDFNNQYYLKWYRKDTISFEISLHVIRITWSGHMVEPRDPPTMTLLQMWLDGVTIVKIVIESYKESVV